MPLAMYIDPKGNIKTARMFPPVKIMQIEAWLKGARAVIPTIPDIKRTSWYIHESEVTVDKLAYTLFDGTGGQATVVIDRRVPSMGR